MSGNRWRRRSARTPVAVLRRDAGLRHRLWRSEPVPADPRRRLSLCGGRYSAGAIVALGFMAFQAAIFMAALFLFPRRWAFACC
jgi:hypothetical protein